MTAAPEPGAGAGETDLADVKRRTWLAAERTWLAWWRTGLGAAAVSIGVGRLLPGLTGGALWPLRLLGLGYGVVAIAVLVIGAVRQNQVAAALRRQGAALLVDATHSAGVLPCDVAALDPDFLIFPTYKWLLGPYGRAFLYVAKRHHGGLPLEQTAYGRRAISSERAPYLADTAFVGDARRFDMGERDHFISMEMASIGMEMMADWGAEPIAARLGALTERLAQQLGDAARAGRISFPASKVRSPHILSLGFPGGVPKGLTEGLAAQKIYVAPRLGRLRVSPHVYNDDADIDRFARALLGAIR